MGSPLTFQMIQAKVLLALKILGILIGTAAAVLILIVVIIVVMISTSKTNPFQ